MLALYPEMSERLDLYLEVSGDRLVLYLELNGERLAHNLKMRC
jgi:hypothetical protein